MFKEKNLDLGVEQKVKAYAEMSEDEKVEFKMEKERDLEKLKDFLVKYGIPVKEKKAEVTTEEEEVEGVKFSIVEEERGEKLKLIIEQKYGEGIWHCLHPEFLEESILFQKIQRVFLLFSFLIMQSVI